MTCPSPKFINNPAAGLSSIVSEIFHTHQYVSLVIRVHISILATCSKQCKYLKSEPYSAFSNSEYFCSLNASTLHWSYSTPIDCTCILCHLGLASPVCNGKPQVKMHLLLLLLSYKTNQSLNNLVSSRHGLYHVIHDVNWISSHYSHIPDREEVTRHSSTLWG